MALSLLAIMGVLAGVTVVIAGDDSERNAHEAAEIFRRSTGAQIEQAPARAALRSPLQVTTRSSSRRATGTLPASIYDPLDYASVKPMTGKVSPAIFQTTVDSTNTNGQQRRMALIDANGPSGILCRDIGVPHRNHQLVKMNGEHIMMRLEHPADKGDYLTARCRQAIAMLPIE